MDEVYKKKLGLYNYDVRKEFSTYNNNDTKNTLTSYSFLHTVSNNAKLFIRKERQLAQEAKNLLKRFSSLPLRNSPYSSTKI